MNWKAFIISVIITAIISTILISCLSGCEGTGFEKQTTLIPDRVGIQVGHPLQDSAKGVYNGIYFNAQWDLK